MCAPSLSQIRGETPEILHIWAQALPGWWYQDGEINSGRQECLPQLRPWRRRHHSQLWMCRPSRLQPLSAWQGSEGTKNCRFGSRDHWFDHSLSLDPPRVLSQHLLWYFSHGDLNLETWDHQHRGCRILDAPENHQQREDVDHFGQIFQLLQGLRAEAVPDRRGVGSNWTHGLLHQWWSRSFLLLNSRGHSPSTDLPGLGGWGVAQGSQVSDFCGRNSKIFGPSY